jgi:hypothetical protein
MKSKVLLASMLACFSLGAIAQSSSTIDAERTTIGVTAGVNWFNVNGKNMAGDDLNNRLKLGFTGGLNVELPLGTGVFLQPGIEFKQKGAEWANGNKLTLNYIDVPVNLVLKPSLGNGSVLIGFGPYLGYGLGGKVESPDGTERDVVFNNDYVASEAADVQFKKLDAGANVMAGMELASKLSLMLKAQLGLMNINPKTELVTDPTKYKNTGFGVSLGYRF